MLPTLEPRSVRRNRARLLYRRFPRRGLIDPVANLAFLAEKAALAAALTAEGLKDRGYA